MREVRYKGRDIKGKEEGWFRKEREGSGRGEGGNRKVERDGEEDKCHLHTSQFFSLGSYKNKDVVTAVKAPF